MERVNSFLMSKLKEGDTIVLGCSGGPDSMALFDVLNKLKKQIDIKIICAHVNHKVRKESDEELVWLQKVCDKHKIIFESMSIDNYGDDNFHNEARNIRYKFFESIVRKYNAKYLMTAHHGDAGFKQVVEKDGYTILRPLVYVTKDTILEYDKKNDVDYVIDKSNFSDKYTRNRYRKVVLPFLKKEDKNVHLKFLKYSKALNQYEEFINKVAAKALKEVTSYSNSIDLEEFKELEEVIQNKIINNLLSNYYQDDMILISDIHTELVKKLMHSKKANSVVYLPNGVLAVKNYNKFYFEYQTDQIDNYEIEIIDIANLPNGKNIKVVEEASVNNNFYCRLNKEDLVLPLRVRTRKSGDRMKVKGLNGSKKVKDIFIDSKIPINKRDLWPIVVDSNDVIVWIPGLKKSKFDVPKNKKCDIILKYY